MDVLNVPKATEFLIACRNFDGGFGCTPGESSCKTFAFKFLHFKQSSHSQAAALAPCAFAAAQNSLADLGSSVHTLSLQQHIQSETHSTMTRYIVAHEENANRQHSMTYCSFMTQHNT